ncbi:hypothetical protein THRCLA_08706 [Thraustotheca clavata]|uniref:BZIP domain-containing protein n=1 Tax=Thraustotheca clavata TaxID=74557 RepID=A0A1V9Z3E8_9STRA|nr:hypothetical protein THRCLA_08706 [Thraustotheca clavata]
MARSKSYRVKRRLNDREAKRRARNEYLEELASLRSTIQDLKSTLQALVCKPVQWQDIAVEMQNAAQSSQAMNEQLRNHVEYTRSLVCQLRDWVETMRPASLVTRLSAITWYDVGLEHDPELRRIALDWIAKQLLHSTEIHICPAIFPHSSDDLLKAEWGQQGRKLVLQKVFNATPEQLAQALWISNQASSKHSLQPSIDNTNRFIQILYSSNTDHQRMCYVREESHTTQGLSIVHLLHICVFEPDRIVVAYRSISHDADFEPWDQHESIQEW